MKNWWKQFKLFSKLAAHDQRLLSQTFFLISTLKVGLRLMPFQQFRCIYHACSKRSASLHIADAQVRRNVWAIRKVSTLLNATCLPQALALTYLLRTDERVNLLIGIRRKSGFEAHAWVERDGVILLGKLPDFDFQPIWIWRREGV